MCGIIALILANRQGVAAAELFEGLSLLQHRGQDAAGIVTCGQRGRLYQCKANGMVRDVFDAQQLVQLVGSLGVGHVRYPTAGSSSHSEAQPFYVNSPYGIVFAHNGNLVNAHELRQFLDKEAHRHVNTDSDSELLLNIFANNLQQTGKIRINEEDIFTAIEQLYQTCHGGYACVAMIAGYGIVGFRDPNGIRPIVYGRRRASHAALPDHAPDGPSDMAYDYMFASESVALDALGFTDVVDVRPGEAVIITRAGIHKRQLVTDRVFAPCIFEYVYFARPDTILDGVSVYNARLAMGEALADQIVRVLGPENDIDVVIPVPDTSRVSALQLSYKLRLPYREGFIKNRYIGRTFIMPGQTMRRKNVRRKLNAMAMEFAGKNVLLVDDSIVRGTTSQEIVQMARDVGAKKVYFASAAPAIRYANVYGIDMPSPHELVAYNRNEREIAEAIGADHVIFQALPDLVAACNRFNPALKQFDTSVFDGHYVAGDVSAEYLRMLDSTRNDDEKMKRDASAPETIGLHNHFGK
ncbi:nucleophile aminohydrolase [Syncephalis pseudoplumigaleata]|uniref:Amidophosphoribosyltransferase n=1 Tax=Syncephalis pseudoplumigaleata TaxID=1712513 RepID=A0A4P9Z690_9FUNG|nr:nucleophile aminohydrolase [Syncephalis pseudoplumigaleata]|eukprot:RKP27180.1 nucleophile aminohydrolase [Syncephalis pseudoplumigaleata]